MHVAHGGGDAAVPQNALHLCQVHAGLQKIRRAGMPKLMQAVDRHARATRNSVDGVADRIASKASAVACHQQCVLT
jgi:hypothetical protein